MKLTLFAVVANAICLLGVLFAAGTGRHWKATSQIYAIVICSALVVSAVASSVWLGLNVRVAMPINVLEVYGSGLELLANLSILLGVNVVTIVLVSNRGLRNDVTGGRP